MILFQMAENQTDEKTAEARAVPEKKRGKVLRRVLVIVLAALLAFVLTSMASSVVIFSFLFTRSDTPGVTELVYADIDAGSYPRREISFVSDGAKLFGCLYGEKSEGNEGLIVIVSGIGSGVDRHLSEIEYFVDRGFCVFAYDGTGVGKSEGKGTKGLPQFKRDLEAALDSLLAEQTLKELPLFLYGHSAGGYAVTTVLPEYDSVTASVSISGFDSPNEIMWYHARRYTGFLADLEYPFLCLQNFFVFGRDACVRALDAINKVDTPILIVEGSDDVVVPYEIGLSRFSERITNPNVSYLLVDEAKRNGHSTIWLTKDAAEYHYFLLDSGEDDPAKIDKDRVNEANVEFLETIVSFYLSAIGKDREW